jgi:hypothetical protein
METVCHPFSVLKQNLDGHKFKHREVEKVVKRWVSKQDREFCQQELRGSSRDRTDGEQLCIGFQLLLDVKISATGTGEEHSVTILTN